MSNASELPLFWTVWWCCYSRHCVPLWQRNLMSLRLCGSMPVIHTRPQEMTDLPKYCYMKVCSLALLCLWSADYKDCLFVFQSCLLLKKNKNLSGTGQVCVVRVSVFHLLLILPELVNDNDPFLSVAPTPAPSIIHGCMCRQDDAWPAPTVKIHCVRALYKRLKSHSCIRWKVTDYQNFLWWLLCCT